MPDKGDNEKAEIVQIEKLAVLKNRLEEIFGLPAAEKVQRLLDDPMCRALVRELPPEELHLIVREVDADQAASLIALASPRQINTMLDLELWHKDYFVESRFKEWLELLQGISMRKALSVLLDMETELLVLFFKRVIQVWRRPDDVDSLEMEAENRYTPDNLYYIEFINKDFQREMLQPILEFIYGYRQDLFVMLMDYIITDSDAQLEEDARQFRKGRLEDRGFPDYYEAQELFSYRDPKSMLAGLSDKRIYFQEGDSPPGYLITLTRPDSFLAQVLSERSAQGMPDELKWETAWLCHQIMAAEGIDFSDVEQIKGAVAVAHGYLNIGLEYLSVKNVADAVNLLDRLYLKRIFQAGYSLTLDLKKRARSLLDRWGLQRQDRGIYLFDPDYVHVLLGLTNVKPLYHRFGTDEGERRFRAFSSLAEVKEMEEFLDYAAAICTFFFVHLNFKLTDFFRMDFDGIIPNDRREVYFSHLWLTAICRRLLAQPPTFEPIEARLLIDLHREGVTQEPRPMMKPHVVDELRQWLMEFLPEKDFDHVWRFAAECIDIFNENFAPLKAAAGIDPRFIKGFLVKA